MTTALARLVAVLAEAIHGEDLVLPEPHLVDVQSPVDLELVDATAGPHHLDREIGPAFLLGLRPEHVTLVGLGRSFLRLLLEVPAAVRSDRNIPIEAVALEQATDHRLLAFVTARRTHDLHDSVEVS